MATRDGELLYKHNITVRVLLCVSSVPASCVHIWFVSCPCFLSLWVNSCPAVCMWLCVNYPVYLVLVFWVWFRLVYSLFPGVSCLWALSCPALMFIKYYYLSLRPHLRVLVPPSCVHRDRRPDLTVSGTHSPRFVFHFQKYFVLFLFCLFRGKEVAARHPAIAHCKSAWEFGGIAASPLAASPHARRSREISAAGGGSPKPASWLPSSRVAAPPGVPFAGDHATGSPLTQCPAGPPMTQCPPDRRWLNARRITADSSLPDRRWLKPTGSPLTHARWPPLSLAPWIKSTCHGQECRVCLVVPTGTF